MSQAKVHVFLLIATATLSGCGQPSPKPIPAPLDSPKPSAASPPSKPTTPAVRSDRVITIRALDNEYQGSTAIQPDNRLDHQKGAHD